MEQKIEVYKYGGSVTSTPIAFLLFVVPQICLAVPEGVRRIFVFSAFGKTTNALQDIYDYAYRADPHTNTLVDNLEKWFRDFCSGIGMYMNGNISLQFTELKKDIATFNCLSDNEISKAKNKDRILSFGEKISLEIVSLFMIQKQAKHDKWNAGDIILTNSNFGAADVIHGETESNVHRTMFRTKESTILIAGYIGEDKYGNSTTLGREGSDFTAVLMGALFGCEFITLFKDVEGIKDESNSVRSALTFVEVRKILDKSEQKFIYPKALDLAEKSKMRIIFKHYKNDSPGTVVARDSFFTIR